VSLHKASARQITAQLTEINLDCAVSVKLNQ